MSFKQPEQGFGMSLPNNPFGGPQSLAERVAAADRAASYYAQTKVTAQGATVVNQTGTPVQATAAQVKSTQASEVKKDYLVTLTSMLDPSENVIFYNMPEISEQRSIDYEPISIVQGPGEFQKYKGTKAVQWSVNGVLTSRTSAEAKRNLQYINRLRGWTMPFFGANTAKEYPGRLGGPPPVLELKGFRRDVLGPIPVVLTNLNWQYPQDVDWIPVEGENTPFPAVFRISLTLVESYSTQQFNNFNLKSFYSGSMVNAWGLKAPGSTPPPPPPTEVALATSTVPTPPPPTEVQQLVRSGVAQGQADAAKFMQERAAEKAKAEATRKAQEANDAAKKKADLDWARNIGRRRPGEF